MPHRDDEHPVDDSALPGWPQRPSVLVVAATAARRAALARAMRMGDVDCGCVATVDEAARILTRHARRDEIGYQGLLIDLPDGDERSFHALRALERHAVPAVLVCPETSFDLALAALRAGAADIVPSSTRPKELSRRVRSALRSHPGRPAQPCSPTETDAMAPGKSTPSTRSRAATPTDSLTEATQSFGKMIRSELDVETLLRQLLEFILAHGGPTNAAVFLPGSSGDFSLGAYVNYTCPKETVEVLLDHLANVAAPRLEHTVGVLSLSGEQQLRDRLGDGADWLMDHNMLAFTCRDPGDREAECLAVVTLFRDQRTPFDPVLTELAARLGPVFGAQLGRVVRIHHRHLPRDKWSSLGDPMDDTNNDQGGMAA